MLAIDTYLSDIKKISHRGPRHTNYSSDRKLTKLESNSASSGSSDILKLKEKMAKNGEEEDKMSLNVTCVLEDDEILASNITQFNGKNRFLLDDETDTDEPAKQQDKEPEQETNAEDPEDVSIIRK